MLPFVNCIDTAELAKPLNSLWHLTHRFTHNAARYL